MIVLVDTDVLVDVALDRARHATDAAALLDALEHGASRGFVAWHTISNFYYLVSPRYGRAGTRQFIDELVHFLDIAATTRAHLRSAAQLPFKDFEDAMQVGAAMACSADFIATRNVRDFRKSPIPAMPPSQVLARLA